MSREKGKIKVGFPVRKKAKRKFFEKRVDKRGIQA
ncbi:hypothetical protein CLOLEP_00757 [[Clostridium] leptum DSM 753]|uniref:Uncharacterized protein n=1 Tax=[Clostridium] leptum DSM 753 TaxID=428125 RepID=A7VQC9_9FIRM|nr:hypothetical protein CLOLEP_00757 [[Clostridium] leptum DSM 753]